MRSRYRPCTGVRSERYCVPGARCAANTRSQKSRVASISSRRSIQILPTCGEPLRPCVKRSKRGAIPWEKKCVSDGTAETSGCVVTIRCSQSVPLRRAPTLKTILSFSGLSRASTFPSPGAAMLPGDLTRWRRRTRTLGQARMAEQPVQTVPGPESANASVGADRVDRFALGGRTLRQHTARGTMINGGFDVAIAGLGVSRRFLVAIFLTASDYGVWGLIFVAVTAVLWFKDIGITDKYIQQDDTDQEAAFQKAFTLNLIWTLFFCVLILVAVPVFSLIYGQPQIIAPGSLFAVGVLGTALQTPTWVFYRQMKFREQRILLSIEPVVGFIVTIALGAAGA